MRCWGTGNPMREFLHVNDLATACIHVLEKWSPDDNNAPRKKNGEKLFFLNVGSGQEITIKELAELIAKLTNFNGDILWDKSKPDGTFRKNLDSSRIRLLGWEPKINLESGVSNLIEEIKIILEKDNNKNNILKNF